MRWIGRRTSDNIEDRRGSGGAFGGAFRGPGGGMRLPVGRAGGLGGLGIIVFILAVGWLLGVNPLEMLSGGNGPGLTTGQQPGRTGAPTDEAGRFVATVLADTEDAWGRIFKAAGRTYTVPTLVLFTGQTESACGFANAAVGPFYCSGDRKLYVDLDFYRELRDRFQVPGDFAEAYVIAHEVGHHVQNLLGIMPKVEAMRQQANETESNQLSIRLELQADCLAGIWAHLAEQEGILEVGDIDEALNAAAQIGDDAIQMRTQGYVVPESFNHGTAAQRSRWFKRGYNEGDLDACDTFGLDGI